MAGRPSTAASELREPLVEYLNTLHEAYLAQSLRIREATLPVTPSGKVNLSALAVAMKAYFPQLEKFVAVIRKDLYRAELLAEINLLAEQQGLLTAADTPSPGDAEVQQRMAHQAKVASSDARAAINAKASESRLREELVVANAEIERLQLKVISLNAQIDLWRSGIAVRGLA